MPDAMPARFTGTEPVSECDAGVPAKPDPDADERVREPDLPVRRALVPQGIHREEAEADTKTYPSNSVNRAPRASMSFADLGATRTMRKTAGRMDAPACSVE